MDRAYSFLVVKKVDKAARTISGIASSPSVDRAGDILDPMGAKVALPIPLLLDHNHLEAVGEVEYAKPNAKGIPFRAHIKEIDEPGPVKDLCDSAWSLVANGLRKAVSVGFRPLEFEHMKNGGTFFKTWEWFELSLCSIPCNPDCTISEIKRFDQAAMERAGQPPALLTNAARLDDVLSDKSFDENWEKACQFVKNELGAIRAGNGQHVLYTQGQHDMISAGFKSLAAMLFVVSGVAKNARSRLTDIEGRLEQMSQGYKGVWKPGTYPAGSFVTHGGSMWHADKATDFKPGEGGGWTLAVKSGRDGKDAK